MQDFEAFQRALAEHGSQSSGVRAGDGEPNYMDSLMNSMSLVLDEFYNHLTAVGVSSVTGDGMKEFFAAVDGARAEYETEYRPEHDRLMKEREAELNAHQAESVSRLMRDLSVKEPWKGPGRDPRAESWGNTEPEDNEDEDDSGEEIDRSEEPGPFANLSRARGGVGVRPGQDMQWPRPS